VYPTEISTERVLLETYTGWVQSNIAFLGHLEHFTVKSFLPIAQNMVKFYQTTESDKPGSIIKTTVVASPGAMAPVEDEANVFAVDAATVALEPQTFGGIEGNPLCLVLNARLGLLNTTMHNYTYSVNVLTKPGPQPTSREIPTDIRPAGGRNPDFEPPH
ncbi:hypothetical protein ACFWFQ_36850, partial [Nocardia salmonicida]|uniref:hypothetical protein n=1 Tax=Nocardia salmonicida TaxID=53431 RepID=UPI003658AAC3